MRTFLVFSLGSALIALSVVLFLACGGHSGNSIFNISPTPTASSAFTATGSLITARDQHRSNTLLDGTVLVTGGFNTSGVAIQTAEIYNPNAGIWSQTIGAQVSARALHAADIFSGGPFVSQVLLAGGQDNSAALNSAELYSPSTGMFTATASLAFARYAAVDAALTDGSNTVLDAGGLNASLGVLGTAELYVPGTTPTWELQTSQLNNPRESANAINLQTSNNAVLITGGLAGSGASVVLSAAELYVPNSTTLQGVFTPTGSMVSPRVGQASTLISPGTVLITGGVNASGVYLNTAEIYSASTGTFTAVTDPMINARAYHRAVLVPNTSPAMVLIAGGINSSGIIAAAEFFNTSTNLFLPASTTMINPREDFTTNVLNNGLILIAGGLADFGVLNAAELYP